MPVEDKITEQQSEKLVKSMPKGRKESIIYYNIEFERNVSSLSKKTVHFTQTHTWEIDNFTLCLFYVYVDTALLGFYQSKYIFCLLIQRTMQQWLSTV